MNTRQKIAISLIGGLLIGIAYISSNGGLGGLRSSILDSDPFLVAHYKLNGDNGALNVVDDDTIGSHDGTAMNDPAYGEGKIDQAMLFDATDDYVTFGDTPVLDGAPQMTIALWTKFDSANSSSFTYIFGKHREGGYEDRWLIAHNSDEQYFVELKTTGGGAVVVSNPIRDTLWHHIVATYDGTTLQLYIDGVSVGTPAPLTGTIINSAHSLCLWGLEGGTGCTRTMGDAGAADDIRIYSSALDTPTIGELYALGGGVVIQPINGQCSSTLNQCTQGTFFDLTDTLTENLWSCAGIDGGTSAQCSSPKTIDPNNLTLTVQNTGTGFGMVTGDGISCGTVCTKSAITTGTSITLTAIPTNGSTFTGWTGGGCSGTNISCTLTMSTHTTVRASFTADLESNQLLITNISPKGKISNSASQTTLSLNTNRDAICKYSRTAGSIFSEADVNFSSTGGTSHSVVISNLAPGKSYHYFVRCIGGGKTSLDMPVYFHTGDWVAPVGIPDPKNFFGGFGVDRPTPAWPASWTAATPSETPKYFYVDNTAPNATDSGNMYGHPGLPRKTPPAFWDYTLTPGDFVYINAGRYTVLDASIDIRNVHGTPENPVWFSGNPDNHPVFENMVSMGTYGGASYIVFENIDLRSGVDSGGTRRWAGMDIRPTTPGTSIHHILIRNSTMTGTPEYYSFGGIGIGGSELSLPNGGVNVSDIAIFNVNVHTNGAPTTNDSEQTGVYKAHKSGRSWVLDSTIHAVGADGIAGAHGGNDTTDVSEYYYIGRNVLYESGENCIDLKSTRYVVISENECWGPFGREQGWGIVIHSGANPVPVRDAWLINNRIHHVSAGIIGASTNGTQDVSVIGNSIYDVKVEYSYNNPGDGPDGQYGGYGIGILAAGGSNNFVFNNTIYDSDRGIGIGQGALVALVNGNIINSPTTPHIFPEDPNYFGGFRYFDMSFDPLAGQQIYGVTTNYNMYPQSTIRVRRNEIIGTESVSSNEANGISGNPLFANPTSADFRLQSGSPAINASANFLTDENLKLTERRDATTDQNTVTFYNELIADLIQNPVDFVGTARPQGGLWDIGAYEYYSGQPEVPVTDGQCSTTLNQCSAGNLNNIADSSTQYLWNCTGINGGTTAQCTLPIVPPANIPPAITLTTPGTVFTAPASITLSASATDIDGTVSKVEFFNGTTKLGEDTSSPYSYSWTAVPVGTYIITARATDDDGAMTTSSSTTIIVSLNQSDPAPPTVSMMLPRRNNAIVSGLTTVIAKAEDNIGVASVQFQLDGVNLQSADTTYMYMIRWDTTTVSNGEHTLKAIARDTAGNVTSSNTIKVLVENNQINIPTGNSTMPVGIPNPGFGINEVRPARPTSWNAEIPGYYYIDRENPNASDSGRTYGSPSAPKKTIPSVLPAGSYVEVHGIYYADSEPNPYLSQLFITANGTSGSWQANVAGPVWVVGQNGQNIPSINHIIAIDGSYLYIDGIKTRAVQIGSPGTDLAAHHIMIRNSEVEGDAIRWRNENGGDDLPSYGGVGVMDILPIGDMAEDVKNILIYRNYIHNFGPISYENDYDVGYAAVQRASYVWLLENVAHTASAGFMADSNNNRLYNKTHHIYAGKNEIFDTVQTGLAVKYARDVVFSENYIHDILPGEFGSPSKGIGAQYGPKRLWILNNRVDGCTFDCTNSNGSLKKTMQYGIKMGGTDGSTQLNSMPWSVFIIGNVIRNIHKTDDASYPNAYGEACIQMQGVDFRYIVGNTLYDCDSGINLIAGAMDIVENNIISNMNMKDPRNSSEAVHIRIEESGADQVSFRNNLLYQPNGTAKIKSVGGNTMTINQFKTYRPGVADGTVESDPLFVNASAGDFRLQTGSPAINTGFSPGQLYLVPNTIYSNLSEGALYQIPPVAAPTASNGKDLYTIFTNDFGLDIRHDFLGTPRPQSGLWDIGAFEYYSGQPEVPVTNGACSTTLNQCLAGTLNNIADSSTQYLWNCTGINGGTTAQCTLPITPPTPIPGTCGPAAKSYTAGETFPTGALCTAGTPSSSSPVDPTSTTSTIWTCSGTNGGATSPTCTATRQAVIVTPDITPPSPVTGLTATNITQTGFTLSWTASTDAVGVVGYKISQGGVVTTQLGTSISRTITGLTASTNYVYTITAFDAAGNESIVSAPPFSVTTLSTPIVVGGGSRGGGGGGGGGRGATNVFNSAECPTVHYKTCTNKDSVDVLACEKIIAKQTTTSKYRLSAIATRWEVLRIATSIRSKGNTKPASIDFRKIGKEKFPKEYRLTSNGDQLLGMGSYWNIINTKRIFSGEAAARRMDVYTMLARSICLPVPASTNAQDAQKKLYEVIKKNGWTKLSWQKFGAGNMIKRSEMMDITKKFLEYAEKNGGCEKSPSCGW